MRVHGYCQVCHKIKLVRVKIIRTRGVQIGLCDDCEAKR